MTRRSKDESGAADAVEAASAPINSPEVDLGDLRARILAAPEEVLEDPEIMAALLGSSRNDNRKVVDLRGALVDRLEDRLNRLRRAHKDVVEAAFDNMNGVEQTHRAALALLETDGAESLAARIRGRLPELLGVEEARLCLCLDEPSITGAGRAMLPSTAVGRSRDGFTARIRRRMAQLIAGAPAAVQTAEPALSRGPADDDPLDPALLLLPEPLLRARCPEPMRREPSGRRSIAGSQARSVALQIRDVERADRAFFGSATNSIAAVATIALDLSPNRNFGALVIGAADPAVLRSGHMVELLNFLGGVVERMIRAEDLHRLRRIAL